MIVSNTAANSIFAAKNQNIDVVNKISDELDVNSALALSIITKKTHEILNKNEEFKLMKSLRKESLSFAKADRKIMDKMDSIRLFFSTKKPIIRAAQDFGRYFHWEKTNKLEKCIKTTRLTEDKLSSFNRIMDAVSDVTGDTRHHYIVAAEGINSDEGEIAYKLAESFLKKQENKRIKKHKEFYSAAGKLFIKYEAKK